MPLPLAPLFGWLIGLGLAWAAREERQDQAGGGAPLLFSRAFAIASALAMLVFAPVVGYFAAFHGDWAYLYVIPWQRVPSAVDLILVVLASATIPAGLAVGRGPARGGRRGDVARLAAGPAVVALLVLALSAKRLVVSGSFAQVHGAFGTEPITSSALGRSVLLAALALAGGIAWSVRALRS